MYIYIYIYTYIHTYTYMCIDVYLLDLHDARQVVPARRPAQGLKILLLLQILVLPIL